jgi:hypothetical protein
LTLGALAAHGLPIRQGFTIRGIPTWRGGVEVAEAEAEKAGGGRRLLRGASTALGRVGGH